MATRLFPSDQHDHKRCTAHLMKFAETHCQAEGLRLTKLRRDVLEEVAAGHKAVGAYEILDKLAERGEKLAPISVYRCLDFLLEAGLIHKLQSTNAYFVCQSAFEGARANCAGENLVLLICEQCGAVGEADGAFFAASVEKIASQNKFEAGAAQLEILGHCRDCRSHKGDAGSGGLKC